MMHQKKCLFISPTLECFAGGKGTANCHDHVFHSSCPIKRAVLARTKQ
ncbi:MAG: hypothetical protein HY832_03970 [Candidatus Aenigmarchaeota archaeon]|nr:hypothetical protein [Candidatus Aenigmarchaeota archaeon]